MAPGWYVRWYVQGFAHWLGVDASATYEGKIQWRSLCGGTCGGSRDFHAAPASLRHCKICERILERRARAVQD